MKMKASGMKFTPKMLPSDSVNSPNFEGDFKKIILSSAD